MEAFSLPWNRIPPRMVWKSFLAMCSRSALRSRPTFSTACCRICRPAHAWPLAQRSGSLLNFFTWASKYALASGLVFTLHDPMPITPSVLAAITFL
ncbi:hypothetical protein D3C72_2107590 [compost metagenome]